MHAQDMIVRCLAMRRDGHFVALCLDFDLAAQGDSFEEAEKNLEEQISDYVREAATVDREHAPYLLRRKAPLRYRLMFRVIDMLSKARNATAPRAYESAMPLVPIAA